MPNLRTCQCICLYCHSPDAQMLFWQPKDRLNHHLHTCNRSGQIVSSLNPFKYPTCSHHVGVCANYPSTLPYLQLHLFDNNKTSKSLSFKLSHNTIWFHLTGQPYTLCIKQTLEKTATLSVAVHLFLVFFSHLSQGNGWETTLRASTAVKLSLLLTVRRKKVFLIWKCCWRQAQSFVYFSILRACMACQRNL